MEIPYILQGKASVLFTESALACNGAHESEDALIWFRKRQAAHQFRIRRIALREMKRWGFDEVTGSLRHDTGRFFSIRGIDIKTNWGPTNKWQQPIIDQPEIGYLGFLVKMINGVLHFLVQAKMEPGNINYIQLAPTLQATKSNFTRAHKGTSPPYLEYFQNHSEHTILLDVLQSEQGARFLRKRNRNIILQVTEDVPILEDYCWMSLAQIQRAMNVDNLVNMDARTVLSCITYSSEVLSEHAANLSPALLKSLDPNTKAQYTNAQIISWFTDHKFRYSMKIDYISLFEIDEWVVTEMDIHHKSGNFFSVIGCEVEADNREVQGWNQPMVKPSNEGLIAFIIKEIDGVLHFLVQAKVEPGNFDVVEMAPTVHCITGTYKGLDEASWPPYVKYVSQVKEDQVLYDTYQSEEGGRFYREENRNMIIKVDDSFEELEGDQFAWMTLGQLKHFIQYNNFVNVEARCLLSCLSITGKEL